MASIVNLSLRGLAFLWTLLIMAIVGNMIAMENSNPSIVNYSMFVAVFSMLSLFYLIPAALKDSLSFHPLAETLLDVLNVLFFFCGGVALAAELGAHSCSNKQYVNTNKVTRGSSDNSGRCREAQATCAFLWFGFACYTASAVVGLFTGRGRK